jgi:hypothetical protein
VEVVMNSTTRRLLLVAAAVTAASIARPCSAADTAGSPPEPASIKPSCSHVKSLSTCTDYTAEAFSVLGEDFHKSGCTAANGAWAAQPCPAAKAVAGACAIGNGRFERYYTDGNIPYKTDAAVKDCTGLNSGKWLGAAKPTAPKK